MATSSDKDKFDGLVQDCSNTIANALELLQSCIKPLNWSLPFMVKTLNYLRHLSVEI